MRCALRMLSVNPATDIDLPRKPVSNKRYLTHQQVADLATESGEYDALVLVLAYCGLRYGEATALRRRDIDFDRAQIEVHSSVEHVNGQYRLGPTKTHERRSVPVPPPCSNSSAMASSHGHPTVSCSPAQTAT
jgi:integrase